MLPAPHMDGRSVPAMYQRGLILSPSALRYPIWSATANCEDIWGSRTSQASTSVISSLAWAKTSPAARVRNAIRTASSRGMSGSFLSRNDPPLEGEQQPVDERPEEAEHQRPQDDLGRIEERAALHDEIAEPGVGTHELGADDDEEREAEAHAERDDDPWQRGGDDHAPDQLATARAQAGRGAQQHHVHAQDAGRDAHEHREHRRVADERDLRRLAEAEPHQEHGQKGQRWDGPHELDDRLDQQSHRRADAGQQTGDERHQRGEAEALGDAHERGQHVARQAAVADRVHQDGGHGARRGQQHGIHHAEGGVAVRDDRPAGQGGEQRDHSCTLATSSFTSRVSSLSYCVNSAAKRSRVSPSLIGTTCLIRPGADVMTTTRSARYTASRIECVTNRIVLGSTDWMRASSSWSTSRVWASSAPNGSSIRTIAGSLASARAMATPCFIPPESWTGYLSAWALRPTSVRECLTMRIRSSEDTAFSSRPNATLPATLSHGEKTDSWKTTP